VHSKAVRKGLPVTDSFGTRLRSERLRRNLTQEQFAHLGGVSRVSQHLYEQDARAPDTNYLLRLGCHGIDAAGLLDPRRTRTQGLDEETILQAFRTVDELARDEQGNVLPLDARAQQFQNLLRALSGSRPAVPPIPSREKRQGARAR
jgi:transcriptional regulator with XRE-family HTH domain